MYSYSTSTSIVPWAYMTHRYMRFEKECLNLRKVIFFFVPHNFSFSFYGCIYIRPNYTCTFSTTNSWKQLSFIMIDSKLDWTQAELLCNSAWRNGYGPILLTLHGFWHGLLCPNGVTNRKTYKKSFILLNVFYLSYRVVQLEFNLR